MSKSTISCDGKSLLPLEIHEMSFNLSPRIFRFYWLMFIWWQGLCWRSAAVNVTVDSKTLVHEIHFLIDVVNVSFFLRDQLIEQNETNKQRVENCNSLYLCSVLMLRNINWGGMCLKTDMEVTKVKQKNHPPPHPHTHTHIHTHTHTPTSQTQEFTASASKKSQSNKKKKKAIQTKFKQCSHRKLCTTNVNKTSTCVFVTKRLSNSRFNPTLYNVIHYNSTNELGCVYPAQWKEKRSWQPVSCILSLEWSRPPLAPSVRARRPQVLRVPYSQRMHEAYKLKKISSSVKTASAYTCISNCPWRIFHTRSRKIDTSQDFQCDFPEKQNQCSIVSKGGTLHPPNQPPTRTQTPLPNPSVLQLCHFLFHLFFISLHPRQNKSY